MKKILTLGEIMLRLKTKGNERFFQSPEFEATFGGGEANVAVSLSNFNMPCEFLTVLPKKISKKGEHLSPFYFIPRFFTLFLFLPKESEDGRHIRISLFF